MNYYSLFQLLNALRNMFKHLAILRWFDECLTSISIFAALDAVGATSLQFSCLTVRQALSVSLKSAEHPTRSRDDARES